MEQFNPIGKVFAITMDRPIGTPHPKHPEILYPINYGYVEGLLGGDGEEQDVYLLGIDQPVISYTAPIIAVIHRFDDVEEKWVAAPESMDFTLEEIRALTHFQEQFYHIEIRKQ